MDFDKALSESLKDKHTHTDSFLRIVYIVKVLIQFALCQQSSISSAAMIFQEVEPHLSVFAYWIIALLGEHEIGIKNTVLFVISNFVFCVFHYVFLTNYYSYKFRLLCYVS